MPRKILDSEAELEILKRILSGAKESERKSYDVYDEDGERISNAYVNKDGDYMIKSTKCINLALNCRGGHLELIHYKKPLVVPEHVAKDPELISDDVTLVEMDSVISTRKYQLNEKGEAVPVKAGAVIKDLMQSIERSQKRSIQNFYNYALSNTWEYFCTFTFGDKETRLNKDMLTTTWKNFVKALRKDNPDVIALATYERFKEPETGETMPGFHMHCLLGKCDLKLKPARNYHTGEFLYTKLGNQIFNCLDWLSGFNTVVCINPNSVQLQVVNYMSKYMTKDCPAPYGCHRYFYTRNIEHSLNYLSLKSEDEIKELIERWGLVFYKEQNGALYYRC